MKFIPSEMRGVSWFKFLHIDEKLVGNSFNNGEESSTFIALLFPANGNSSTKLIGGSTLKI